MGSGEEDCLARGYVPIRALAFDDRPAAEHQCDPRTGPIEFRPTSEPKICQTEIFERRHQAASGPQMGDRRSGRAGLGVVDAGEQFWHVAVFGRQSGAQDVVRGGHRLNDHASQVGVQCASWDDQPLAGGQDHVAHQQRDRDTWIAGVVGS
jgi:hypothetical protein